MKTSGRLRERVLILRAKSIRMLFDAQEYHRAHGVETWKEFREEYDYLKQKVATAYNHVRESKLGRRVVERLERQGLDSWLSYVPSQEP